MSIDSILKGLDELEILLRKKHMQGRHSQRSHAPKRGKGRRINPVKSQIAARVARREQVVEGRSLKAAEKEALEAVQRLVTTGGVSGTPVVLSPAASAFLKKTVTKSNYNLYRGVGLIRDRVSPVNQKHLNALKVGDAVPGYLAKSGNDLASYSTKKSVANNYAQGTVSLVITAKIPAADIVVDTSKLKRVLQEAGIKQSIFDSDDFNYFNADKEVIVREPTQHGVISHKTGSF